MNKNILNTGIQEFIKNNLTTDILSILQKKPILEGIDPKEVLEQIEAKKRCEKKLPTWYKTANIYYPNKINIEQTSSEITARYKASLIEGKILVDLTGGFGVDSYYFAERFDSVIHCEIDTELSKIVKHNLETFQKDNIITVNDDGIKYLKKSDTIFDCIYVDPSRRNNDKGKVFMLADCLPNVPEQLNLLFGKSATILIKTSPILDLSVALKELRNIYELHIVAVKNEVKELLWLLKKDFSGSPFIKTINITDNNRETFEFVWQELAKKHTQYGKPQKFLYEPNASIMKSGAFNLIAEKFNVYKLHQHSHLYTSNELIEFPGRKFKTHTVLPYVPKKIKKELNIDKANVATRNFPENPDQLKKRLKIKDGGEVYIFFTTDLNDKKIVLVCSKADE